MGHVGGAVEKPSLLGRPLPITVWKREDWVGRENTTALFRSLVRNTVSESWDNRRAFEFPPADKLFEDKTPYVKMAEEDKERSRREKLQHAESRAAKVLQALSTTSA